MFTSFSTALSALSADTTAIGVVGNNLANLNTSGFKASSLAFHDLLSQTIGSGSTQVGFGVATPVTLRHFTQGALQATGGPLDAAIQGDGFFIVQTPAGAIQYTRGGNFQVNSIGNLITTTNEVLQGWSRTNGVLNTNVPIGPITVPVGSLAAPRASTAVSVDLNLNAAATAGPPPDTFSTALEVFDSLGISHVLSFDFTKTANPNEWSYSVGLPAGDATPAATPVTGTLTFDGNGILIDPAVGDPPPVINVAGLNDGATDLSVTWNLFDGAAPRLTQFAQKSASAAMTQDGSAAANLVSVGIADGGGILAQYSNGQQIVVGQLALATVRNPESLLSVGNNNFQVSAITALPVLGLPGTGGRGVILGSSVESSTVDIAREFTNLIIFQRSYQANAHVVTTVDQLSQDTINLKQ
jgi:flagellar hook protein FlgE